MSGRWPTTRRLLAACLSRDAAGVARARACGEPTPLLSPTTRSGRLTSHFPRLPLLSSMPFLHRVAAAAALCGVLTLSQVGNALSEPLSLRRAMATAAGGKVPVVVCADFDQTISVEDTIALLFKQTGDNLNKTSADAARQHAAKVNELVNQYDQEMKAYYKAFATERSQSPAPTPVSSHERCEDETTAGQAAFDEQGLLKFLDGYARTDMASVVRVVESRTLSGIQNAQLEALGRTIALQDASVQVLATLPEKTCVISSNWSGRMIKAALKAGLPLDDDQGTLVITNELEVDATTGITNGNISPLDVQSPMDKHHAIAFVRRQPSYANKPIVYIGDSTNDLLGLLAADVGFAIGVTTKSSIYKYATQFGVKFEPLNGQSVWECVRQVQAAHATNSRVVFMAKDWQDIQASLQS